MLVGRQTNKWICRACQKESYGKRLFHYTGWKRNGAEGVPTGLILRAKKFAQQYRELEQKAAQTTEYTPQTIQLYKRINELSEVANNLREFENTQDNINELKRIISASKDKEMISLAKDELQEMTSQFEVVKDKLKASLVPRHPQAHLPCLMEFKRGIGGDDAAIFAADLFKMYQKFAISNGWTWEVLSYNVHEGIGDGLVDAAVSVSSTKGDDVYGTLRTEAGVHRVQRVPITESQGRIHTSAAAVMIFPQIPSEGAGEGRDEILNMDDVKVEVMRAKGPGGQHVNKTESAVRMTHVPTGIVVSMQDSRSQHANRAAAILILRARIAAKMEEEKKTEAMRMRKMQVSSTDRSDKIRTWNFNQNRVTDHRGFKFNDLRGCMEGNSLGELLEGVAKVLQAQELEEAIEQEELCGDGDSAS